MRQEASQRVEICGVPISLADVHEVLREIERGIVEARERQHISITNTESMYHALRIPEHLSYIRSARFSLCDGVGVIAAGWAWGHRIRRLNGPILQLECCRHGASRGWRHFFYGGKDGVADQLATNLTNMFPGLVTAGTYCPPFGDMSPEEDREVVRLINEARPDIVWVGLGLLKQERWISQHLTRIDVPWMIGVGGAFDYHSGAVPWAPPWMRRLGMEWIFRLMLQPRLRAKRYWWSLILVIEATYAGLKDRFARVFGRT